MSKAAIMRSFDCSECYSDVQVECSRDGWPLMDRSPEVPIVCPSCGASLYMHGDEGSGDMMMWWLSTTRYPALIGE